MTLDKAFDSGLSVDEINKLLADGLIGWLGIQLLEINNQGLVASMPVNDHTMRPGGILHGGANLAFAETLAGMGSMLFMDNKKEDVRGISVTANHVGAVSDGLLRAEAKIIHKGRTTHLWNVDIFREDGKLISTARVTNMIVQR
ncbi:MAG: PaaI family thioesterase [Mangrovibacterium sp.]